MKLIAKRDHGTRRKGIEVYDVDGHAFVRRLKTNGELDLEWHCSDRTAHWFADFNRIPLIEEKGFVVYAFANGGKEYRVEFHDSNRAFVNNIDVQVVTGFREYHWRRLFDNRWPEDRKQKGLNSITANCAVRSAQRSNRVEGYIDFGDAVRDAGLGQCQYVSRYLDGRHDRPNLGQGIRFLGDVADYHGLTIHKDDAPIFIERVREYKTRLNSED